MIWRWWSLWVITGRKPEMGKRRTKHSGEMTAKAYTWSSTDSTQYFGCGGGRADGDGGGRRSEE